MKFLQSKKITALIAQYEDDLDIDDLADAVWIEDAGCNPFTFFEAGIELGKKAERTGKPIFMVDINGSDEVMYFFGTEDEVLDRVNTAIKELEE